MSEIDELAMEVLAGRDIVDGTLRLMGTSLGAVELEISIPCSGPWIWREGTVDTIIYKHHHAAERCHHGCHIGHAWNQGCRHKLSVCCWPDFRPILKLIGVYCDPDRSIYGASYCRRQCKITSLCLERSGSLSSASSSSYSSSTP